jgi:hypothetical protein
MINVSVLSHKFKEGKPDAVALKKIKAGKLAEDWKPAPKVFVSLVVDVWEDAAPIPEMQRRKLFNLVITDCVLTNGVFRPPGRPGGFGGKFFHQIYVLNGIKNNEFLQAVYRIVEKLAAEYDVSITPIDECLAGWLPDKKVFKNFANFSMEEKDIVWKS